MSDDSSFPKLLRDLLPGLDGVLPLEAPAETAALWSRWREIVGLEIAQHAEPTSLRQGVLRVRAESPVWATELGYLSDEIKQRANKAVGRVVVAEVRVWTGGGPMRGEPRPRRKGRSGPVRVAQDDPVVALEHARGAWARTRRRAFDSARSRDG